MSLGRFDGGTRMTNIVEFRTNSSRSRPRPANALAAAGTGQIVIFPGVRVSYWDDVLAATDDVPPKPHQSNRKSKSSRRR